MRILVTGAAGFIGAHTAKALLAAMRLSVSIISIPITIWHLNAHASMNYKIIRALNSNL